LLDHFVVELGHRRHGMTPRLGPKHPGLSAPLGEATSDVDTSRRITQTGIVGVKALGEPCSRLAISPIDCARPASRSFGRPTNELPDRYSSQSKKNGPAHDSAGLPGRSMRDYLSGALIPRERRSSEVNSRGLPMLV